MESYIGTLVRAVTLDLFRILIETGHLVMMTAALR